ncbi:DUF4148 domain-containing protein [Paraburkholderia sp. CNPSo 3076]|uniref:DUF4148 domain-containing protein n=1 Tax=Paraburkholderia sp. CNPSo 3076 TaxID=2940936 RepID=UPI00225C3CB8|nr:DUF4148 domain-containing protein [Paraburkholderia sp. CNPSo 3076]MCX5539981.1 DUF4148 domain-containing protein [Paraburkholderia sp. CNPSo 3076]
MNRITQCVATISLLVAGASAFAAPTLTPQQCNDYPFVKPQGPVTHRQLINELEELEALGYDPATGDDAAYPDDLNRAQRRLWDEYAADCPHQGPMATVPAGH